MNFISFAKPLQTNSAVLQAGLSILASRNNGYLRPFFVVSMNKTTPFDAYGRLREAGNAIPCAERKELQSLWIVGVGKAPPLHHSGNLSGFVRVQRVAAAHPEHTHH